MQRLTKARSLILSGSLAGLTLSLSACSTLPSGGTKDAQSKTIVEQDDAPEISRSGGAVGGVVVLWPRVIPRSEDPETLAIARMVQGKLVGLAESELQDRPLDVRPDPERVCPKDGCDAMSLGAVVTRKGDRCAVVALVSGSGESAAQLVPWAAEMQVRQELVPFREPPENALMITDYASCDELADAMELQTEAVKKAIASVALAE